MKKLLALLLAVVMVFCLSACGNEGNTSSASQSNPSSAMSSAASQNGSTVESATSSKEDKIISQTIVFTAADLEKAKTTTYVKPKNVIYMIGDGMGLNDIEICNKFSDFKFDFGLVFDQLPNRGYATTRSHDSEVTDSAASATALATGVKTRNGMIGKNPGGKDLENISEIARGLGKKIGIVTSDSVLGATPTAFSVHNASRDNGAELARSLMKMKPDVLIGSGYDDFVMGVFASEETKALYSTVNVAGEFGLFESALKNPEKKDLPFFGFSSFPMKSGDYRLAQATQAALYRLENEKGFFLMIENAGTDKAGHSNNMQGKVDNPAVFDKAVAVAVKYCIEHPDTVLIITSDHETGGVTLPSTKDYTLDQVKFTTTNHTGVNVGVFALGYGTEYFNGKTVDNTDIAKFAIKAVRGQL